MQRMSWMMIAAVVVSSFGCGSQGTQTDTAISVRSTVDPEQDVVIPAEVELLFNRGELAKAVETLTSLIEKSPRDANLHLLRSTAAHRLNQNEQALADVDRAIELDPRNSKLFNNRGFIRLHAKLFSAAEKDFDRAIELSPKYKHAYNNRGLLRIAREKYAEAIEEFNQALSIDNRFVDAYNNRGFAEFELGQTGKALDDFNIAIVLNSDYVNAWNNRGLLRARLGDYENAAIDFTQAMLIDPLNPKYYEHRRNVYRKLGDFPRVVDDDNKIEWLTVYHQLTSEIATEPNPSVELVRRAAHFSRVENFEKAIGDLDRALTIDPMSPAALLARGKVKIQLNQFASAVADAEAALAQSTSIEAHSILGDAYLGLKEYDRAIENYNHANRIDADVAEAYYHSAKALGKRGEVERAKLNLQQALALDPDIEERLH